jgi:type I restriction enzyme S subunit
MELMPDYEHSDVGPSHENWEIKTLLELAEGKKELFDDGDWIEAEHITTKGIRLIQTGNIGIGRFVEKEDKKYIYESSFTSLRCKELKQGDLLICRLADPAGRSCVLGDIGEAKIVTSVDVTIFRPPAALADRYFLSHIFSTSEWFKAVSDRSGGTTHKRISRGALGRLSVKLPPLPEQRAIAAALNDVDALLTALEKMIAKKRDLKQASMQQLLTGKTRLPGFSGEWKLEKLKNIGPLQRGFDLPNRQLRSGPYPVVYSNGVLNYHVDFQAQGPGVVTGRSGTIGKVTYLEEAYWPHNTALWVTSFQKNDPRFVFYLYTRIGFERFATGSGVPTLNRNDVHAFEVTIPPTKAEQSAIANILSDMDTELLALEARREKTRYIKQAMMQKLLTGRTRLITKKESHV